MPVMKVVKDCEADPWLDLETLRNKGMLLTAMGPDTRPIRVGGLPRGMESGKTSVTIVIELPDGSAVLTETSLALFLNAARILQIAYPNG